MIKPALPYSAGISWTLDQVRAALFAHELGDLSMSAALVDAMGADDRIFPCLNTRVHAFTGRSDGDAGLPFELEANERGDKRRNAAIASQLDECWWDMVPEASLGAMHRALVMLGAAPGQLSRVKDDEGVWQDIVEPLPPHNLWRDESRHVWRYRTLDQGDVDITPGVDGWVLFEALPDYGWMAGAVRALGVAWIFKSFTDRDWARWSERHGLPIITVKEPSVAKPGAKTNFYQSIRTMGSTGILRLPRNKADDGFEVNLLEASDGAYKGFDDFIARLDRAITIVLLGQDGTTQQSSSSGYAQSKIHNAIRGDYLAADAQLLSTQLRDQVIKPWGRYYVANWKDSLAPWPDWQTEPPEDLAAAATTLSVFGDGLTKLVALGAPVDVAAMCERFGVPLRPGGRVPEPEAPDPNAPPPALPPGQTAPALPGGPPPPKQLPAAATTTAALARDARHALPGIVAGQAYVDGLGTHTRDRAQRILAPDVRVVLAAIDGATSLEEIRARILVAFRGMNPKRLAELTAQALVLADLAGRFAVLEDAAE